MKPGAGRAIHQVDSLHLGVAGIGGLYGEVDYEVAHQLLTTALRLVDKGQLTLDTAPFYGCGQRYVGMWHSGLKPDDSQRVQLTAKVGRIYEDALKTGPQHPMHWDFSPEGVVESVRLSKKMLRLPRAYRRLTVYLHDVDVFVRGFPDGREAAMAQVRQAWMALMDLKESGAIARIGIGMNNARELGELVKMFGEVFDPPDEVLCAGEYNLLRVATDSDRATFDDLVTACKRHKTRLVLAGILGSGFLVGARVPGIGEIANYQPVQGVDSMHHRRRRQLEDICSNSDAWTAEGRKLGPDEVLLAAALKFADDPQRVDAIVHGVSSSEQLFQAVDLMSARFSPELVEALDLLVPAGTEWSAKARPQHGLDL